jgi:hypothetical protein
MDTDRRKYTTKGVATCIKYKMMRELGVFEVYQSVFDLYISRKAVYTPTFAVT